MRFRRTAILVLAVSVVGIGIALIFVIRSRRLDAALHDPNPAVRAAAVRSLDTDSETDRLLAALKDENPDVRLLSAMRLGGYHYSSNPQNPEKRALALIEALKDGHAGVRRSAAYSLAELWPTSEDILTAALKDRDPRVRAGAVVAIRHVPSVRIKDRNGISRAQAKELLHRVEPLLDDEDAEVRDYAAKAWDYLYNR